jgi:hypothetical protein
VSVGQAFQPDSGRVRLESLTYQPSPEGAMSDESEAEVPEGASVMPEIPAELGINPLLVAVLHAVVFLEGSEDDIVDPDAAIEAMEYIAMYLQRLSGRDLQRVREDLEALTAYAKQQKWPKENVRFFKECLGNLGVGEESAE